MALTINSEINPNAINYSGFSNGITSYTPNGKYFIEPSISTPQVTVTPVQAVSPQNIFTPKVNTVSRAVTNPVSTSLVPNLGAGSTDQAGMLAQNALGYTYNSPTGQYYKDGQLVTGDMVNNQLGFGNNTPSFWGGSFLDWGNFGLNALSLGAGIYGGLQQLKLGRKALDLQRDAFEWNKRAQATNFNNQVAAMNDAITTRNRAAAMQNTGATGAEADAIANTYHRPELKTIQE